MRRRLAVAALAVVLTVGAASAPSAVSDAASGNGSARSAAANATPPTGSLAPIQTVSLLSVSGGLLGPLLALLGLNNINSLVTSITNSVAQPLVNTLAAIPQSILSSVTTGLTGAGLSAKSPTAQQPRPAAGTYPTCGRGGWTTGAGGDCYGPLLPDVSAAPLVTISTGATQGYATADPIGYVAAAKTADPVLSLLGIPLGDLGLISASASCTVTPNQCTGTQSVSGISLLGGAITATVANGKFTLLKVNGLDLPTGGKTLTNVLGLASVGVKLNGNLLSLSIALNLTQVLGGIGTTLSALTTALGLPISLGDTGTSATLTVNIGPSAPPTSGATTATAYGLAVTSSLVADVKLGASVNLGLLGVLHVANVEVKTAATPSSPNLLDLDLAYATASAGTPVAAWVPPAVI